VSLEVNGKKIYIIHLIEKATIGAMNSLLKFLEEPVDDVVAIITTQNISKVLATIISRCQLIRLKDYSSLDLENYLISEGFDAEDAYLSKAEEWAEALKAVLENKSYPNTNKLRNDLWLNYTELHSSLPNHIVIAHDGVDIEDNIGKFVAVRTYKTANNKKKNDDIRDNFNNHPESKKKFLKLMGNLLAVGSPHHFRSGNIDGSRFDEIRKLSGASDMTDEQIKDLAKNIYDTTVEGLWIHKEEVNKDRNSNKNDYINRNVKDWISDLLEGKNNIRALAFLKPEEFEKYKNASIAMQEEIEKKHISIHHKIAIKYNGVIADGVDYNKHSKAIHPFNHLSNLMLVIGGKLHDSLHAEDKVGLIDFSSVRDSRILLAPTKDGKSAKAVSMTMPEDKEMKQLRPQEANKKTFIQLRKSRGAR
jgi:hypothetical protein